MTNNGIEKRYDFLLLFDVQDGNPNGDPDAGNLPRVDPETGHGLVTDVCLKRKIRNYVALAKTDGSRVVASGFDIYVKEMGVLNAQHKLAYDAKKIQLGQPVTDEIPEKLRETLALDVALPEGFEVVEPDEEGKAPQLTYNGLLDKAEQKDALKQIKDELGADAHKFAADLVKKAKSGKATREQVGSAREWMCQKFFDVRTFGAVMSTGVNCGQVRGPVQLTFSRSVDPIVSLEHSITRVAVTREEDAARKQTEMGRKNTVPYGLYVGHGFVVPPFAAKTGFSTDDLALVWEALEKMFEIDRSAARGLMTTRALIIFEHQNKLGDAPAHKLFDRVQIKRKDPEKPPRRFEDYEVKLDGKPLDATIVKHVVQAAPQS
jgi:CRISPR-associated protein Csd2